MLTEFFSKSVICNSCGTLHNSHSSARVIEEIESFNQFYDSLPPEKQQLYFDGQRDELSFYLKCHTCGNDYHDFHEATLEDIAKHSFVGEILHYDQAVPGYTAENVYQYQFLRY
jgi:protein-arginine kinase activator protein McsA